MTVTLSNELPAYPTFVEGIRRAPVVSCGTALGPAGYPRVAKLN